MLAGVRSLLFFQSKQPLRFEGWSSGRSFDSFPRTGKVTPRGERPAKRQAAKYNGIGPVSSPHQALCASFPQGKPNRAAGTGR